MIRLLLKKRSAQISLLLTIVNTLFPSMRRSTTPILAKSPLLSQKISIMLRRPQQLLMNLRPIAKYTFSKNQKKSTSILMRNFFGGESVPSPSKTSLQSVPARTNVSPLAPKIPKACVVFFLCGLIFMTYLFIYFH